MDNTLDLDTTKMFSNSPIFISEKPDLINPWSVSFSEMFHMSNDSYLFKTSEKVSNSDDYYPLLEAKMVDFYNHRSASYESRGDERGYRVLPENGDDVLKDKSYKTTPFYFVNKQVVLEKIKDYQRNWLCGFKKITAPTNERTFHFSIFPIGAIAANLPTVFINDYKIDPKRIASLLGNLSSLILDYVARQKIGGINVAFYNVKQLPIFPPEKYTDSDTDFISRRIIKLVYNAWDMKGFAEELGYYHEPFEFDSDVRAVTIAELDAYYAKLYGLTRDELRYILDPSDVMGDDYPSETFRVLKNKEMNEFGEYRTQRLVLEAWDKLEAGELY